MLMYLQTARAAFWILLLLTAARPLLPQEVNRAAIEPGEDRLVSVEKTAFPLVEPHLAISPSNPKNLLGGAIVVVKPDLSSLDCTSYMSSDGGGTWKRWHFGLHSCADPWVAYLLDGTAVFAALELLSTGEDQLLIYRSSDGGLTWNDKPVNLGSGHDHPTLVVDRSGKQFNGSLYVISGRTVRDKSGANRNAVFAARSADGGATFLEPAETIPSNLSFEAQSSVVLSDGTLVVPFADHNRMGDRRRLEQARDWVVTSRDGGKTFSIPKLISESCDARGGWSSLGVGPSGKVRDRLYHVCALQQFAGVEVRYSDDLGESWSDSVRVDHPGNVTPYTRNPTIAVNSGGVIGVTWADGRDDPAVAKSIFRCQNIYFAASIDGAKTFLPEVKVSSQKSCPLSPQSTETALRYPAGGEYMGLVAALNGAFHLLWSDSRTGTYQLRTSTVTVKPTIT